MRQGQVMDDLDPLALAGVVAAVFALIAWMGDRRRIRRSNPDAVGFMPWTSVFFWALLAACVSLGLAARHLFGR
jgi:hypothetical protein